MGKRKPEVIQLENGRTRIILPERPVPLPKRRRALTRASREVYERKFVGALTAPKDKPWTKPSTMIDLMETAAMLKGELHVKPFYDWAKRVQAENKDRGNVFLEYAWQTFNREGRVINESDCVGSLAQGAIQEFYSKWCGQDRQGPKVVDAEVVNAKRLKRRNKRRNKAETPAQRDKRVGDEFRAQVAADKAAKAKKLEKLRAQVAQTRAEEEFAAKLRKMLRGK